MFFMDCARFSWDTVHMITRALPETDARLAGYAYLINNYELGVPVPAILSAIGKKHTEYETDNWRVFTPRHAPENSLYGHLTFALRYEGIDLSILSALFQKISKTEVEKIIQNEPAGSYARRIWFLFEYLTDYTLDISDISQRGYVDLVDPKIQYAGPVRPSKRHRINNNLPGVKKRYNRKLVMAC